MVTVKPDEVVVQRRGDVVVYQLPFEDWSTDLVRPDNKSARISQRIVTGEPLIVTTLPYVPGRGMQEVKIKSGSGQKRGEYVIVRTVQSDVETRVRSFTIKVIV